MQRPRTRRGFAFGALNSSRQVRTRWRVDGSQSHAYRTVDAVLRRVEECALAGEPYDDKLSSPADVTNTPAL